MKIVFLGASEFGGKCLQTIIGIKGMEVTGIITTNENIYIASKKIKIKNNNFFDLSEIAQNNSISLLYVKETMLEQNVYSFISNANPDLIVVSGWYKIIPNEILELASKGTIGIHAGMLPYYKGGSPIVWAMINGEKKIGVSLFYLSKKLDAGDIIEQRSIPINFNDDIGTMYSKMEVEGLSMLNDQLPKLQNGTAKKILQKQTLEGEKCIWPSRVPDEGILNWKLNALEIYNFIRAQTKPYPGAFTFYNANKVYIWKATLYNVAVTIAGTEGTLLEYIDDLYFKGVLVATFLKDCPLLIMEFTYLGEVYQGKEIISKKPFRIGQKFSDYS